MANSVPLPSFEVHGFRGIRYLRLPELGRVNLFVGKNNAGKTSLLEAIRLYAEGPARTLSLLFEVLQDHTDYEPRFSPAVDREPVRPEAIEALLSAAESIFYGAWGEPAAHPIELRTDPGSEHGLRIFGPLEAHRATNQYDDFIGPDSPVFAVPTKGGLHFATIGTFLRSLPRAQRTEDVALMIPAGGLSPERTRERWDRVALSGRSELVESGMRVLLPNLSRVLTAGDSRQRSVFVKLDDVARAVPLQSLGDGVSRVFSIAVALVLAANGTLLIDEFENGLHHSVQDEVWESVFRIAEELNVQVFATTHSWDAVVGFQAAALRSDAAGMLYRLERGTDGDVYAERYTEQDVAVAAEHNVEVR